jgi:hypothetical protein
MERLLNKDSLLSPLPVYINGLCQIYHLTLMDLYKITEQQYNMYLSILCFDIDSLENKDEILKINQDIKTFDLIVQNCISDEMFKNNVINGLELFLREKVNFIINENENIVFFYIGELNEDENIKNRIINRDNYELIKEALKLMNCLQVEHNYKKMGKKARELAEKQKKAREMIVKIKGNSGDVLSFSDLISAFCSYSRNVNIMNVWDMTIYQFDNQFKRMQLLNDYEIGIQGLLHGADPKKINVKHFISKL